MTDNQKENKTSGEENQAETTPVNGAEKDSATSQKSSTNGEATDANTEQGMTAQDETATAKKTTAKKLSPEQETIAELEQKLAAVTDQMLRSLADADNNRKTMIREMEDVKKFAGLPVCKELLPIIDNLGEAVKNITEDDRKDNQKIDLLAKSLDLIINMANSSFEKLALVPVANVGDSFDPNLHQALATKTGDEKDTIAEVLQQGYQLHGRLVRPALVVVIQ